MELKQEETKRMYACEFDLFGGRINLTKKKFAKPTKLEAAHSANCLGADCSMNIAMFRI